MARVDPVANHAWVPHGWLLSSVAPSMIGWRSFFGKAADVWTRSRELGTMVKGPVSINKLGGESAD